MSSCLPTFLHVHDPDSIGAKVLVLPTTAMVLHLQGYSPDLGADFMPNTCLQIQDSNLRHFYVEHKPLFPCWVEPIVTDSCSLLVVI